MPNIVLVGDAVGPYPPEAPKKFPNGFYSRKPAKNLVSSP